MIKATIGNNVNRCQSPSHRGTHFYELKTYNYLILCQSPSHRGTHFYCPTIDPGTRCSCVNPLHIGELISTPWLLYSYQCSACVSIPFTSGNSFLQTQTAMLCATALRVSIPFTSGNSFLPSTLFFVDFMRVSSLDFRGIFQTILKTAVFSVTSAFLSIFYKRADFEGHAFL